MDNSDEKSCALAMKVIVASALPATLKSAIELGLLDLIKKAGPGASVSTAELAAQIPATNPDAHLMLDRILRLLAANSILNCSLRSRRDDGGGGGVERLYSLAPVCKFFTRDDDGVSLAPLLLMGQDRVFVETWYHLKDMILEGGISFNIAYGMNAFEYQAIDPRFNKIFNQAMYEQSVVFMNKILEEYKGFEGLKSLVDVGGGIGASLKMIISKYPSIKGINFDLPHVIQDAVSFPGMEHITGDMFVSVPKGDAIFMKWICHDWSDAHCLKLLKNCYEALPSDGKLIIADRILLEIPEKNEEASTDYAMDVFMLTCYPGGKERTEREFQALAQASGFNEFQKVCCCYGIWIMELHK